MGSVKLKLQSPAWAAAACATAIAVTLTPAGQLISLQPVSLRWLPAVAALIVAAVVTARAAARLSLLARRL